MSAILVSGTLVVLEKNNKDSTPSISVASWRLLLLPLLFPSTIASPMDIQQAKHERRQASMLRAIGKKLTTGWDSIQVELHGQYSPERLRMLHEYAASSPSLARIACVLVATPVPSLMVMVLLDAIPLAPPELGPNGNMVFWIRSAAMAAIFSGAYIALMRMVLPEMPLPLAKSFVVSAIATAGDKLFGYALSLGIGFPVPFSIALESPFWWSLMTIGLAPSILRFVRGKPAGRAALRDWATLNVLITSLVFIYPMCNYLFATASASSIAAQSALALLLAVVKIAYKNAFNHSLRARKELRAHIVTFHVEIFSSLFVTFSLQNANSYSTLALLMLIDFAHACSTLYEVHHSVQALKILECSFVTTASARSDCISLAIDILNRRSLRQVCGSTRLQSDTSTRGPGESSIRTNASALIVRRLQQLAHGRWGHKTAPLGSHIKTATVLLPSRPLASSLPGTNDHGTGVAKIDCKTQSRSKSNSIRPQSLTATAAEDAYVTKVLSLLHLTEFAVLTEFVEVIVPIVYGKSVTVRSHH
jgi:hypothetical protein